MKTKTFPNYYHRTYVLLLGATEQRHTDDHIQHRHIYVYIALEVTFV